jgi:glucokinase
MGGENSRRTKIIGVDFGGTKIMAGVFDEKLDCLGIIKVSTKAGRGPAAVLDRIARCVADAVDECDLAMDEIRAVGIGAPGAVDTEKGTVLFAPNLSWENVPLQKPLEKKLDVPVFIENDCNAAALGVYEQELDAKPDHVVGIFIGTGIGAGLIINREIYTGFNKTAGEIGHMVLEHEGPKCGCGNRGCFEALASRTAIFQKIQAAVRDGQKTVLTELLGPDLSDMRSGHLRKAIRKGDKFVQKIVQDAAEYTAIAVGNILNLINPEVVVLGGGVIEALEEEIMPVVSKAALAAALPGTAKGIQIVATHLGDNAGIIGAAVLARRMVK